MPQVEVAERGGLVQQPTLQRILDRVEEVVEGIGRQRRAEAPQPLAHPAQIHRPAVVVVQRPQNLAQPGQRGGNVGGGERPTRKAAQDQGLDPVGEGIAMSRGAAVPRSPGLDVFALAAQALG